MKRTVFLIVCVWVMSHIAYSQNNQVKPSTVGQKMSDFTLTTYQGGQFSMKDMRGKNVVFIVARGKYADSHWCTICQYQYAEFSDLVLTKKIKEKYNLEVVFLMPYAKDSLVRWEKDFPAEMAKIEGWKHPEHPENLSQGAKEWMEFTRANYPQRFDFTNKKVPLPIPILVDDKQEVSKGLDLSRMEWDGGKTLQNVPTLFIIDKEGIVQFKYMSQSAADRPSSAYVLRFIEKML